MATAARFSYKTALPKLGVPSGGPMGKLLGLTPRVDRKQRYVIAVGSPRVFDCTLLLQGPLRVNCSPRPIKDKKKGMISQLLIEFGPFL
jgi:hypothetical protein